MIVDHSFIINIRFFARLIHVSSMIVSSSDSHLMIVLIVTAVYAFLDVDRQS
jgi:hypothetical protein